MSSKKDLAKQAKEHFRAAKQSVRKAKDIFRFIGDKDGEKVADNAIKSNEDGESYVEKRLG